MLASAGRVGSPGMLRSSTSTSRLVVGDLPPRLLDVPGLADDGEVRLRVEKQPQPASDDGVIVGDHNGDRGLGDVHRKSLRD